MTDLDKLAKGLTEAQRRAVLEARLRQGLTGEPYQVNAGGATLALYRKNLARETEVQSISGRRSRIWVLTPLGLALRQHIERTTHD